MGVSEIARRARLPVSTTHRIVEDLVAVGYLERSPDRKVRVGVRLWEIAARAPRALGLREAAMPFMEHVHAVTYQHTQLGVLEGNEVLFIERLSAPDAVVNVTNIGGRLPAHASSSGLVLLAHADAEHQERVFAAPRQRFTDATPIDHRRLRVILAEIRRDGHAICGGYIHPDAMGIAVPVHGPEGSVVAALGVVVPNPNPQPLLHVSGLRTAAQGITRAMRHGIGIHLVNPEMRG